MIPKNINREHIIKAIEEIEKVGIPDDRISKKFLLEYNGKYYPPKYTISLANKYANGKELDPQEFSGGTETNDFLKDLGFNIVKVSEIDNTARSLKESSKIRGAITQHDENSIMLLSGEGIEKSKSTDTQIKIVLCVPKKGKDRERYENDVKNFVKENKADMVVFPEGYIRCKFNEALSKIETLSKKMGVSILSGVKTEEGYQIAVFYNPHSEKGETKEHVYIKHSSARKLAYEYPGYKSKNDPMFNPIIFRGRKIGIMICHDMFFPLITHILVNRGAEILVNLTGGNVRFQKWKNIIRARSLEIKGIFLCTMGHNPNEGGYSSCFAYENGRKIPFYYGGKTHFEGPKAPGFCLLKIPADQTEVDEEDHVFSEKKYSDITVTFDKNKEADLKIIKSNTRLKVLSRDNKELSPDKDGWIRLKKGTETIGLLIIPIEKILDRVEIFKRMPEKVVNHHLILYHGDRPSSLTSSDLLALAKLRAIENRVGILILSDERIALKTNSYKDIQRFRERNGIFGFDKRFLGGPESIFGQGIPHKFEKKYFELLNAK